MEVSIDALFRMIGEKEIQIQQLVAQVARLQAEVGKLKKEKEAKPKKS